MKQVEIVIIGGGPAGLCAAVSAAKSGSKVLIIDRNKILGGQLIKQNRYVFWFGKTICIDKGNRHT